ncbi:uncharacterized protein [Panulirus ornatus]|uniref:uncharacterized protein isoform X2 n=1 Tax=Panulirus ornatus TaxID=150431 RepID=UPI003A877C26
MNYSKTFRVLLVVVVLASSITLYVSKLDDQFVLVPLRPPQPATAQENVTTEVLNLNCKCLLRKSNSGPATVDQFNLVMSWLNLTTKQHLVNRHPNLPVNFVYQTSRGKACTLVPTIFSIEWRNVYWQEVHLAEGTTLLLYSATYDPNTTGGKPCVRILAVTLSKQIPADAWCRFWYVPDQPPVLAKVSSSDYLDYQAKNSGRQMPYLITCPLPPHAGQPVAVSLVRKPCDPATTLLQVAGSHQRASSAYRDGVLPQDPARVTGWVPAVCGPALFYYHNDFSKRLVEWLEILRAEGFGRVFLYATSVHPNLQKVLQYYENEGFLQVTDYTYPPPYINEPSIRRLWTLVERTKMFAQENIYFTDCVLRHMHQHRFIAHYDPDEIPILPKHDNFTHFLDDFLTQAYTASQKKNKKKKPSGYRFQWNYFYDDLKPVGEASTLPEYLWALRHTLRPTKDLIATPGKFKALYDTDVVRGVFSHGTLQCSTGRCHFNSLITLKPSDAYLGHFSRKCGPKCTNITSTKEELFLLKYKDQVTGAVTKVLQQLELI